MEGYEQVPCSIFDPPAGSDTNQIGGKETRNIDKISAPKAQPSAPKQKNINQKSCLAPLTKKEHPPHPALRKKTVAFGKTVNVSQTVEGTSRSAKNITQKNVMNNSTMDNETSNETKKVVLEQLEHFKKEIQDETIKRLEDMNKENLGKIGEMISQAMQKTSIGSKNHDSFEAPRVEKYERRAPVKSKIANIRNVIRTERKIPPEAIPYFERRLQSDPMFRQRIDDVLADEEDERGRETNMSYASDNNRYRSDPESGLMRECVTVQRSIRYDNGVSFDARQDWTKERSVPREYNNREKWSNQDDAPVSVYQPGPSISYYPTQAAEKPYYVEHLPDNEPFENTFRKDDETAKREAIIRKKYGRK